MARPRIRFNNAAFRQLRTLPEVKAELKRRAKEIAADAGEGYEVRTSVSRGRGRARAVVLPTTDEAARQNAAENTLLRALGRHT